MAKHSVPPTEAQPWRPPNRARAPRRSSRRQPAPPFPWRTARPFGVSLRADQSNHEGPGKRQALFLLSGRTLKTEYGMASKTGRELDERCFARRGKFKSSPDPTTHAILKS